MKEILKVGKNSQKLLPTLYRCHSLFLALLHFYTFLSHVRWLSWSLTSFIMKSKRYENFKLRLSWRLSICWQHDIKSRSTDFSVWVADYCRTLTSQYSLIDIDCCLPLQAKSAANLIHHNNLCSQIVYGFVFFLRFYVVINITRFTNEVYGNVIWFLWYIFWSGITVDCVDLYRSLTLCG